MTNRHHAVHPPTGVKPNPEVNKKPKSYRPTEVSAAAPNSNPSLGPVGFNPNGTAPGVPGPYGGKTGQALADAMEADAVHPAVKALTRDGEDPDDGREPDEDASLKIS